MRKFQVTCEDEASVHTSPFSARPFSMVWILIRKVDMAAVHSPHHRYFAWHFASQTEATLSKSIESTSCTRHDRDLLHALNTRFKCRGCESSYHKDEMIKSILQYWKSLQSESGIYDTQVANGSPHLFHSHLSHVFYWSLHFYLCTVFWIPIVCLPCPLASLFQHSKLSTDVTICLPVFTNSLRHIGS